MKNQGKKDCVLIITESLKDVSSPKKLDGQPRS